MCVRFLQDSNQYLHPTCSEAYDVAQKELNNKQGEATMKCPHCQKELNNKQGEATMKCPHYHDKEEVQFEASISIVVEED